MDGVPVARTYPPTMVNAHRVSPHTQHTVNSSLRTPSYNTRDPLNTNDRVHTSSFTTIDRDSQLIGIPAAETPQPSTTESVADNVAIYQHPLFELLKKFFEKCEIATHSIESVDCQEFDLEVKTDILKSGTSFFTDNAEVDALMLKTLQVLRIHLLELEKVNELCKDFCNRYIACLKGKLNSENLMRTLNVQSNSPTPDENHLSPPLQQAPIDFQSQAAFVAVPTQQTPQVVIPRPVVPSTVALPTMSGHGSSLSSLPPQTNTPDSCSSAPDIGLLHNGSPQENAVPFGSSGSLNDEGSSSDRQNLKSKRGILPKQATNIMKAWLFQHLVHPYPTEDEKRQIASQTNLTILQVNNWFINARRRILQPMLDGNSPYSARAKKLKPQKCPAQKAWPDSIGIYSYHYDAGDQLQYHAVPSSVAGTYTVVNPALAPQPAPMIVNVAQGQQSVTQPVQLVQVSGLPTVVQGVPAGSIIHVAPANHAPQVPGTSNPQGLTVISSPRTPQLSANEGAAILVQNDNMMPSSVDV